MVAKKQEAATQVDSNHGGDTWRSKNESLFSRTVEETGEQGLVFNSPSSTVRLSPSLKNLVSGVSKVLCFD